MSCDLLEFSLLDTHLTPQVILHQGNNTQGITGLVIPCGSPLLPLAVKKKFPRVVGTLTQGGSTAVEEVAPLLMALAIMGNGG
jgi:hypothetical protein